MGLWKRQNGMPSFIESEDDTAEETSAPDNNKEKRLHKLLKSEEEGAKVHCWEKYSYNRIIPEGNA